MIKSLNSKWKEFLFGFSGFGPNFLMVLLGAYYMGALNPVNLGANEGYQAILGGTCFILPALFPILYALAKVFDGIIDIPFAHITDTLSTKWGRRRPAIAVCFIPMVVSFAMCWWPIGGADGQLINTLWSFFWSIVFFATYTMSLIAFYGSLSTTCVDEPQRLRVSGYKSFFDTISYCLVYALVPLLLESLKIQIDTFVFLSLPLMLTMLIPLFLIKEGAKYGYPENEGLAPERVKLFESLRITLKNKPFMRWQAVNCCTFFGLQMFLASMNSLIGDGMGMSGVGMAILNTCAFAPVPVMLYLFNKVKAKKGIRFTYQTCLIAFAVSILSFFFGSSLIWGDNDMPKYIIGCVGGMVGSWAIGAFFMMPYLVTAQISSVEEKLTKKNHSAMYFAANAVFSSIVGALSGSLIYGLIRMVFISKSGGMTWAETSENAANALGVAEGELLNLGTLLVPFIVCIACILGAILAFRMPKEYTPQLVGKELKEQDPSIDLSVLDLDEYKVNEDKGEIGFVQIGLWVLSGGLFGFIWNAFLLRSIKALTGKGKPALLWALSSFLPFFGLFLACKLDGALCAEATVRGVKCKSKKVLHILFGCILPILPLNFLSLALLQNKVNKLYAEEEKAAA